MNWPFSALPIACVSPRIPFALYFPHGRCADSRVGPNVGEVGVKSWRCHRRRSLPKGQFSVVLSGAIILPWGPFCVWMEPFLGGWRGVFGRGGAPAARVQRPLFSHRRRRSQRPDKLVIDRARGGLAANWPTSKSGILNHLRTAAADSLQLKDATNRRRKHFTAIRGVMRPASQSVLRGVIVSCEHCSFRWLLLARITSHHGRLFGGLPGSLVLAPSDSSMDSMLFLP
jgi:hypothetical protein